MKEYIFRPFFDAFLIAEKCYLREMPFLTSKGTVIENKFKRPEVFFIPQTRDKSKLKLIYSGTIADPYGIFETIELAEELLLLHPGQLTIIGYCPDRKIFTKINNLIFGKEKIKLIGGNKPVSHQEILEQINTSNLGIISYHDNPAISGRIPTRVYEYIACRLPFIYPQNAIWSDLVTKYHAGIPVNYNSFDAEIILSNFLSARFYSHPPGKEISFDSEETKLLNLFRRFI